jgi:hypothetical protein
MIKAPPPDIALEGDIVASGPRDADPAQRNLAGRALARLHQ